MILTTFPRRALLVLLYSAAGMASGQQAATASFPTARSAAVDFPASVDACTRQATVACTKPARPASKKKSLAPRAPAVPAYDPLAVHPEAAIRDTKAKEIALPGVMTIAGADAHALDFTKTRQLTLANGSNEVVYMSDIDQNLILLPFANPRVIGTEELIIDKNKASNKIYVQFKENVNRTVQVYIEQPGGTGTVYGLKLVPKKIPGQTLIVRDNSLLEGESISAPKGNDYIANTQFVMETVALGASPQGFSQLELKIAPITMNGVVLAAEKMFSSADRDIYVYDVMNPGVRPVTLREQEFDGESVLAISIFPKPLLTAGEHAKVIVIARKQKEQ